MNRNRQPVPAYLLRDATPAEMAPGALGQLRFRLRRHRDHAHELNPAGLLLLENAILSAILDCRDADADADARRVLMEVIG